MIPLVGLGLGGRCATEHAPASVNTGAFGRPVWGPGGLLRDLEMRLGLAPGADATPIRVQTYLRALSALALAEPTVFFAKSLQADPLGTARTLLGWRDELIAAGWDGDGVANGGARLDALARVESLVHEGAMPMPLGHADRVRRVQQTLTAEGTVPYPELRLAEPPAVWPGRWQALFEQLAALGTQVVQAPPLAALPQPKATDCDLARVQAALRGATTSDTRLLGDGSFVVLHAETSWELAECAAALLAASKEKNTLVLRGGDARALDLALANHGLATQGSAEASPWRGALQVLSLAVQLIYAPGDVFRVLDLVTLPGGPFDNLVGGQLARALSEMPGVGGPPWTERKQKIAEYVKKGAVKRALEDGTSPADAEAAGDAAVQGRLTLIAEWLEAPVHDRVDGAPKAALLEAVDRAREFLRKRLALLEEQGEDEHVTVLRAAYAQAESMHLAVTHDARDTFDREGALQLVRDATGGGATVALTRERASRLEVADAPAGARRPFEQVLWWHAVGGTEWRPGPLPWRTGELEALTAANITLPDRAARLAAEAESWQAPVMAATERLVLCVSGSAAAGEAEAHPILTQIAAALHADEAALARVRVTPDQLLGTETASPAAAALQAPATFDPGVLPLPPPRTLWHTDAIAVDGSLSASQIDALIGCPLKWVLDKKARLRAGSLTSIASGPLLLGSLAHRAVEELHGRGALGSRANAERELVALLPKLMEEEAAPLLRVGMGFERAETVRELTRSVGALADLLERSGLRVAAVEAAIDTQWLGRDLRGRIDLLLLDSEDREVVLDLKWGSSTYRGLLEGGMAVQLAVYAGARQLEVGAEHFPHAAYFGLAAGKLLATEAGPYVGVYPEDGVPVAETWRRLEPTLKLVEAHAGARRYRRHRSAEHRRRAVAIVGGRRRFSSGASGGAGGARLQVLPLRRAVRPAVGGAAMKPASGLTLVNASAGSGKTYRLTEEVVAAVGSNVDLEGLAAVTYTRKAAGELGARIRRALLQGGQSAHAQRLPLAYIGTVHAVCLRLIQENAIDAGLSPEVDVIPGSEQRLLAQALERGLEPELKKRVGDLAYKLQLRWDAQRRQTDWISPVSDIMALARGNRIAPASLPGMAERSAKRLLELLGTPERDGAALDAELLQALAKAEQGLVNLAETTKVGKTALREVRDAQRKAKRGKLSWRDWVALQKLNAKSARAPILTPVIDVASRADAHPQLHADLHALTLAIFEAAQQGLQAYQEWKRRQRVVDFVDMIDRALTLLDEPDVATELRRRLEMLVVDEVQDTSPVQLALFLKLHQLATRSSWVGDPKQCIFEFAGADPDLMQAVADWVATKGGTIERLEKNYRSRPELVDACSTLFAGAFALQGLDEREVTVVPHRTPVPDAAKLPPLGIWHLDVNNKEQAARALAEGVQRMLGSPADTPVVDRATGTARSVRPGDIAVLTATNAEAESLANALAERGIRAAVARAGLLATPEGTLVEAALRRVLDPDDTLADAELSALHAFDDQDPDTWLGARLRDEPASRAARARAELLDELHAVSDTLTPLEALDRVMSALDVLALAARWPDPHQRIANLEALRALAQTYEERCAHEHEPATLAGLLRYFAEAAEPRWVRDEEIAADDQHVSEGQHAVTVLTYHRAKGLEWPVVVLSSLDRKDRRDAFDVSPETDRATLDADDPLGGRWIRYWPWPFGQQQNCGLQQRAKTSAEGLAVSERERRERIRLLYVGFTRARDHLVLALKPGKSPWLEELADPDGNPLIGFSVGSGQRGIDPGRHRRGAPLAAR